MAFTDLIVEIPNVIDKELCEEIINRFEKDDNKYQGVTGGIGVDTDTKRSTDLMLSEYGDWADIDEKLFQALTDHFKDYLKTYSDIVGFDYTKIRSFHDMGYQLQRTNPDEFYHCHHDANIGAIDDTLHITDSGRLKIYNRERLFTFILYLNDRTEYPEDGRTQFIHCDEITSVIAEAGKLLLFPANTIYTHRGETLENGVKYLMTGWAGFYSPCNTAEVSLDVIESIHQEIENTDRVQRVHRQFT